MDGKEGWSKVPFPVRTWCCMISEEITANSTYPLKRIRKMTRTFSKASDEPQHGCDENDDGEKEECKYEDNDDLLSMSASLLTNVVEKFKDWCHDYRSENSFGHQTIFPFLDPIFTRHNLATRLCESHVTNRQNSLIADYIISHKTSMGTSHDIIRVEIKPPHTSSSSSQNQSDFVKIGKESKDMIDDLIVLGVEDLRVGGILIEGEDVSTYTMQLKCQDVYILRQYGQFRLLHSPQEVYAIPTIIEHIEQVANLVEQTRQRIDQCIMTQPTITTLSSWQRPSASIPKRTDEEIQRKTPK
ncbi:hypothetical protein BDA99DRAFT_533160 [Phascolomyces articulosus]|uniref:Uncharacterized protein n=1 Tax=Phascolomyces articulosus TaxID=60185 RepID=A0AAD5K8P3_9FUNG|nr:hypothetical protein BDA99DRAFT_533160 [Phascolomyces articulosus]